MTTTENNKLIAEFMGIKLNPITLEQFRKLKQRDKHLINGSFIEDLCYHTSWNWLMEVVGKIESLGADLTIRPTHTIIVYDDGEQISTLSFKNKIEAVYNACVEFIKWYNKQK